MRNRDADGKQLLIFEVKKHVKGVNNMNDMHRMFLYFLERVDREDSDGMVTIGEIFFFWIVMANFELPGFEKAGFGF